MNTKPLQPKRKAHGKTIPIHWTRTFIADISHYSNKIPLCTIEKQVRFKDVNATRIRSAQRVGWSSIFTRAMGLASMEFVDMRRSWLPYPYAHIYEHPIPIGSVAISRSIDNHDAVLFGMIQEANIMGLGSINSKLHRLKTEPVEKINLFKRIRRTSRFPWPIRSIIWNYALFVSGYCKAKNMGTFGISSVSKFNATTMELLTPLTSALNYSQVEENGNCTLRLTFDHRIMDGQQVAQILAFVEEAINTSVKEEILSGRDTLVA